MGLKTDIERMLEQAEKDFNDAARMHFDGKLGVASGRISALKEVLELLD